MHPTPKVSGLSKQLIDRGVKNLREFGYPSCTAENILTDQIFSAFFASMLASNKGQDRRADEAIDALLAQIEKSAK